MRIEFVIPIRTINWSNCRFVWQKRHRLIKAQREAACLMTRSKTFKKERKLPATITMTRIGAKAFDPDAVATSLKGIQDGIADAFGVDDGDERYDWQYRQEIGKEYAVRVSILSASASEAEARLRDRSVI